MIKEELEKEARRYSDAIERKASKEIVQIAYIDAAEPREKQIAELENENKHIYERMTRLDKVLEDKDTQIEKMKCCPNCDFMFRDGNCYYDKECKNKDHWKLRR